MNALDVIFYLGWVESNKISIKRELKIIDFDIYIFDAKKVKHF